MILPVPMMNVLNGGAHADNSVDFQEFMIVPAGAGSFTECLRMGAEVFHALKSTLKDRASRQRSATRAASPPTCSPTRPRWSVIAGIEAAGYEPGDDIYIALDPATSEVFEDGSYVLEHEGRTLSPEEMADYWARCLPTASRSSRSRTAWTRRTGTGWKLLTERLGEGVQLVGDDLFVTNPERLKRGIERASAIRSSSRSTRSAPSPRRSRRSGSPATPATPP